MADFFSFELVSPERLLLSKDAGMVVIPGAEGDFGVLPGHSPLISTLRTGVITVYKKDEAKKHNGEGWTLNQSHTPYPDGNLIV